MLQQLFPSGHVQEAMALLHDGGSSDPQWVRQPRRFGRTRIFLDVGSSHPTTYSNSAALEERGWAGLCIEAFPARAQYQRAGRKCTIVEAVVWESADQCVHFGVPKDGMLGGVHPADAASGGGAEQRTNGEWGASKRGPYFDVEVSTTTLRAVLQHARTTQGFGLPEVVIDAKRSGKLRGESPGRRREAADGGVVAAPPLILIDFMSVDVEGAELEVLLGFPWETHAVGAIVVEHNHEEPKRSLVFALLHARGYDFVRAVTHDDYYRHRHFREVFG